MCMEKNAELLNYVYQNAQMGRGSIEKLLGIVNENEDFISVLKKHLSEYVSFCDDAADLLREMGKEVKEINKMQKAETSMMISMKTLAEKTPDHVSEMLMQGSVMGIIQITRRIKRYENVADERVMSLAQKLLDMEEHNFNEYKKFLG